MPHSKQGEKYSPLLLSPAQIYKLVVKVQIDAHNKKVWEERKTWHAPASGGEEQKPAPVPLFFLRSAYTGAFYYLYTVEE